MKKTVFTLIILAALVLSLAGCGIVPPAESETADADPMASADVQTPAGEDGQTTASDAAETAAQPARQDGERFEAVIVIEGMEETVHYEHIRNETAGFEMDYDYEQFQRRSESDRECFVSVWDDSENPENYLEVRYDTGNAELVASAVSATLSNDYEIIRESCDLDGVGTCERINASEVKGGGFMPEHLQTVYIIPAGNGSIVATVHCSIEAAEGFGRRFSCMLNTLSLIDTRGESALSDEQALSAIKKYCYANNPDLEGIVNAGEYQVSWDVASSDASEIVVLFRSYTGAEVRYYIDRLTGDTFVTEFVPGITAEEERTEESLNVWEYVDC